MNASSSPYFQMGQIIACLHAGFDPATLSQIKYATAIVDDTDAANNQGVLQRMACKLAAGAYAQAGKMGDLEYHVFEKLANVQNWNADFNPFADAVFTSLARNAKIYEGATPETFIKASSNTARVLGSLVRAGTVLTPDVLKTILATGAATGAAGGSLLWLANRHAREDSNEVESTKAKIQYYNNLTGDISDQLKAKGLLAPPTPDAAV